MIPLPQRGTFTPRRRDNSEEKLAFERRLSNMTLDHTKVQRTDRLSSLGHRTNEVTIGWVETLHSPTPPGSVHGLHVIRNNIKRHCFQHHTLNHHWVKKKKIASSDTSEDCERLGRASFRDNSASLTLNLDVPTVERSDRIKLTTKA